MEIEELYELLGVIHSDTEYKQVKNLCDVDEIVDVIDIDIKEVVFRGRESGIIYYSRKNS